MSLSDTLFRLARVLAPDRRKPWIDAMQAESPQARSPTRWAVGAVTTAFRERIIDLAVTGALARAIGGAFVIGTGLVSLPYLARILVLVHAHRGYDHAPGNSMVSVAVICAIVAGLIATGAAIMIAGGNRLARISARSVVAVMGAGLGSLLIWSGYLSLNSRRHITVVQHDAMFLSLLAGPALILAAAAMALNRPRLFLVAALTAFAAEAGQWLVELSPHAVAGPIPTVMAFFGAFLPALLMLSATGLVMTPRQANRGS